MSSRAFFQFFFDEKFKSRSSYSMSCRQSHGPLYDGDFYLFAGCTLTKGEPEFSWSCWEEENDADFLTHTIFLK
jgi:hypothetical protein